MFPLWMLKYLPNMAACHVGISHQACGPNNTIVQGEASSLLAVSEAASVIRRGWADVMISGGCGCRLRPSYIVYLDHSQCSRRDDDPAGASRPFDVDRDGYVRGEGSGALVLETRAHAEARGATILGCITGHGQNFEIREDRKMFAGSAIRLAVGNALQSAQLDAAALDHVNAHGMGSIIDDIVEARAVRELLGDVPVFAPKSYFGNLGAGSGIVEMIASLLGMNAGSIPPTLNFQRSDPECPVQVIHGEARPTQHNAFLALNFSSTGQAAAVVVTRD
jgi:3-oxoacyl-[acyl-carrier-protein] synthase II